jgi:RimJ/RimL family protein N-acetyltransferase
VVLRPVEASDVAHFFAHACDPISVRVAAFAPPDLGDVAAFRARWSRRLSSSHTFVRTVVFGGNVVGHLVAFRHLGRREVGGWFDRACWGQGVATAGLGAFLALDPTRPLYARAAADNAGALRVIERCGFRSVSVERLPAPGRGGEVDEVVWVLE